MRSIYVVYQSSCVWWRLERRSTGVSLSGSPGVTGMGDSVSPGKLWGCRRRSILGTGGQAPTCGVSEAGGSWFCAALGTSASGPCCCSELGTTGGLPESQTVWGEPCGASACGAVGNGSGCWGLTASLTGMAGCALKSSIRGGVGYTGVYFRRNFLFLRVTLPDPSTRTTYWSNWQTSTTRPVLSHFLGNCPVWFWRRTMSPTARGGRCRVCSDHRSAAFICRFLRAISLVARVSFHVLCGW